MVARAELPVSLRTLAVLLEASPPPALRAPRRWYAPERVPIPEEPGRLELVALLAGARRSRGCQTAGDDRLETRAYAVKRYLWRRARRAGPADAPTGRYACSVSQLAVGLAPLLGWPPAPEDLELRAAWLAARRRSLKRWLDDLQAAGILSYEAEKDNRGQWWRTIITLHAAPAASVEDLRVTRRRQKGWKARERHRRATPRTRPALGAIRNRSATPSPATRRRAAIARRAGEHERRRVAEVDRVLGEPRDRRGDCSNDSPTRYAAPPTSAQHPSSTQTQKKGPPLADRAGERAREPVAPPERRNASEKGSQEKERAVSRDELERLILKRIAVREASSQERWALIASHVERRARELAVWSPGRSCPAGRLREAWSAYRHGLAVTVDVGASGAGAPALGLERRAARAIALYEAFSTERPPGWPASGAAALTLLAAGRRAATLAGDAARLQRLATGMRAAAHADDPDRLAAARRRAARRAHPRGRIDYRGAAPEHPWLSLGAETNRRRERDQRLLAGQHPLDTDGQTVRADRYRAAVEHGDWALPPAWPGLA